MDKKERRFVLILFFSALFILLAGCFFREFLIYIWTSTMQVYVVGHGPYLAIALLVYFVMFGLLGTVMGLLVHHNVISDAFYSFVSMMKNLFNWAKRIIVRQKAKT